MGCYNRHCEKTTKLSSVKNDNDRMIREINDLETQIAWKNTAISHAREELIQAEVCNNQIEAKLRKNREWATETLAKKNEEIRALELEIARALEGFEQVGPMNGSYK